MSAEQFYVGGDDVKMLEVKLYAHVLHDGRKIPRAVIKFPQRSWAWIISLIDFEVIHGLSRLVRLLPDKLVTSRAVRLERGNQEDNFLISLVQQLLNRYIALHREKEDEDPLRYAVERPYEDEFDLGETMLDLSHRLDNVSQKLNQEDLGEYDHEALELIKMANDLLLACTAFLSYAHPICVGTLGRDDFDPVLIAVAKNSSLLKLTSLQTKLIDEFEQLSRPTEGLEG